MTKRKRELRIGNLTIEIPVVLTPELLIGAAALVVQLLQLAQAAKIPLQEQKHVTVTIPTADAKDMTIIIPIEAPKTEAAT